MDRDRVLNSITMQQAHSSAIQSILLAGFIAGTLDAAGAVIVYCLLMKVVTVTQLFHGISSGLFGNTIIGNENVMAVIGLLLHYFIAFCFATGYFFVYPHLRFLQKNAFISGLLYGLIVWIIMNLIVVPLSRAHHSPPTWPGFLRGAGILMVCIGLPVSFITASFYRRKMKVQE